MFPLLTAVNLLSVTALPFLFGTDLMTKPVEVLLATSVALLGVIYLCTRAINFVVLRAILFGFIYFYAVAYLNGALFVQSLSRNAAWSLWMTLMTVVPPTIIIGPFQSSIADWRRVLLNRTFYTTPEATVFVSVWSMLLGSLAGCLAIPLDAKVTWKLWPCPQVFVASALHFVTVLITFFFYRPRASIRDVPLRRASQVAASKIATSSPASNSKRGSPAPPRSRSRSPKVSASKASPKAAAAAPKSPKSPTRRRVVAPVAAVIAAETGIEQPTPVRRGRPPTSPASRNRSRTPARRGASPARARSRSRTPARRVAELAAAASSPRRSPRRN